MKLYKYNIIFLIFVTLFILLIFVVIFDHKTRITYFNIGNKIIIILKKKLNGLYNQEWLNSKKQNDKETQETNISFKKNFKILFNNPSPWPGLNQTMFVEKQELSESKGLINKKSINKKSINNDVSIDEDSNNIFIDDTIGFWI